MERDLIHAIHNGEKWIKRFTRHEYKKAFSDYCQCFGPIYWEAIQAAQDDSALQSLVDRILDEKVRLSRKQRLWNRPVANLQEKQMVVLYLSPMLLSMNDSACICFAKMLQSAWKKRWPKQAYEIGDFTTISKSFNDTIYGTDLKKLSQMIHGEKSEEN